VYAFFFLFSRGRRHTTCYRDWSSDVCSSDLVLTALLTTPARADQTPLVCEQVAGRIICDRPHATTKRLAIVGAAIVGTAVVVWRSEERRVGKACRCLWSW